MSTPVRRRPLFFGDPGQQLYGCLHEPAVPARDAPAVLVCQPTGQEYIRAHRPLAQLADRIAALGAMALRFDYFGCGDSAGESEAGGPSQWVADVGCAAAALQREAATDRIAAVGLRLGGTLAWLAASAGAPLQALGLWSPVVTGDAFLRDARTAHRRMMRFAYVGPTGVSGVQEELFGFPVPPSMSAELERLSLLEGDAPVLERALLADGQPGGNVALMTRLRAVTPQVTHVHFTEHGEWFSTPSQGLVPRRLLEQMASWAVAAPTTSS